MQTLREFFRKGNALFEGREQFTKSLTSTISEEQRELAIRERFYTDRQDTLSQEDSSAALVSSNQSEMEGCVIF